LKSLNKKQFEEIVRGLSYFPDRIDWETFRAPWVVLENNAGDCDDLAIMCAFYARAHRGKWRWYLMGNNRTIKHIATKTIIENKPVIWDVFGSPEFTNLFTDQWRK